MARKTPRTTVRTRQPRDEVSSLIDWREPEANAHVLDWRERAHQFGLLPASDDAEGSGHEAGGSRELAALAPERILAEEEPEAFEDQDVEGVGAHARRDSGSSGPGVPHDDLDLVRLYLANVGGRKLLSGEQKQEIGRSILAAAPTCSPAWD